MIVYRGAAQPVSGVLMENSSVFGHVSVYPPDPIFHVNDSFNLDKDPRKVNLSIGGEFQPFFPYV